MRIRGSMRKIKNMKMKMINTPSKIIQKIIWAVCQNSADLEIKG